MRWCTVFLGDLELDFDPIGVTEDVIRLAIFLARTHGLRGYDAVQLAAGMETNRLRVSVGLTPAIFVSADQELNAAARSEGLSVDDPNAHV